MKHISRTSNRTLLIGQDKHIISISLGNLCWWTGLFFWLILGDFSAIAQNLSPVTFSYNGTDGSDGSAQVYTVPSGIYSLSVVAYGAAGGDGFSHVRFGGKGGKVEARLQVTPGQSLTIYVGGSPSNGGNGYNGGGNGVTDGSGGGGGATDIRINGLALANRVIVAGGGGGGGISRIASQAGVGGGLTGGGGLNVWSGQGGTQTAGGAGGGGSVRAGNAGSLGIGGDGFLSSGYSTGAGGGGYYGGGSGGDYADGNGGGGITGAGGGGSSYTNPSYVTNVTHTQGARDGHGEVTIQPILTLSLTASTTTLNCNTPSATLTANGGSSYLWSTGSTTSSITVTDGGVYSVTVTASNGYVETFSKAITNDKTPPSVSLIANCSNTNVTLTATSILGATYAFSNGATQIDNGNTAKVSQAGTYSVTVTGTNGCSATASVYVPGTAGIAVLNQPSNQTVCVGVTSPITFSGDANAFVWTSDNLSIGLPASGTSTTGIPSFTAVNTTSDFQMASITVTPQKAPVVYVANGTKNTLDMVNVLTNSVMASVPVGNYPQGVSVSSDGSKVYVANNLSNTVSVVNTATRTVIATIPVSVGPIGTMLSPDGSRLYVTCQTVGRVNVINTETNTVITDISVGSFPEGMTISPDGSKLYVAVRNADKVSIISTETNTVMANVNVGSSPSGVALSSDGNKLYVTNAAWGNVNVINTATNVVSGTVSVGSLPMGIGVSLDGSKVYVANYSSGNVSVINTSDNTIVTTVSLGGNPIHINASVDGRRVYVVNASGSISVLDAASDTVLSTISVGGYLSALGNFVSQAGCVGEPKTFTLSVRPAPEVTLTSSGEVSCSTPTTITATFLAGAMYTFSAGATQVGNSNTATVTQPGMYSVVVTTADGCTTVASTQVNGNTQVPAVGINAPFTVLTCSEPTINLYAYGAPNIRWNTDSTNNDLTVTEAGVYSITATSPYGCTATASVTITIDKTPPTAGLIANGAITCANPVVTLTATDVSGATYAFSSGTTQIGSGNTATVTQAGTYSVIITTVNGCSSSASIDVTGNTVSPEVSLTASGSHLSCSVTSVTLTASSIPDVTYTFSSGATQIESGNAATVTQAGTYSVVVTSPNGCSASANVTLTANSCQPVAWVVNHPTDPGTATGTISLTSSTGTYTPNMPVVLLYQVTDSNGQRMTYSSVVTNAAGEIVLPNLSAGVYGPFKVAEWATQQDAENDRLGITPLSYSDPSNVVTLIEQVPDLTVVLQTSPVVTYGQTEISLVAKVINIGNVATNGLITLKINKDASLSLHFLSDKTELGSTSVQNSVWAFDDTSDNSYYTLTTNASINVGGKLSIGLTGTVTPNGTSGSLTLSAVLLGGSGGESRVTNNTDADMIDYF